LLQKFSVFTHHFNTHFYMTLLFTPEPTPTIPIVGSDLKFPARRVYCVGRNYEEHAKEMGFTGREPPFFFLKPANALVVVEANQTGELPYPSLTQNFHHELELVVAIGKGGKNIAAKDAHAHIYGYAIGLDMTRRDLQNDMKKQGRPWCIGKAFDHSAPIGPIIPADQLPEIEHAKIELSVDGMIRQSSSIEKLIWNLGEVIEHLSAAWELKPGDLIYSGTPEGVAAVVKGNVLVGRITGLPDLKMRVV
jgi:fumarylpyruvate hydrolase